MKLMLIIVSITSVLTPDMNSYAAWPPDKTPEPGQEETADQSGERLPEKTQAPETSTQLSDSQFKQAIKDLNSEDYELRENAQDRLLSVNQEQQKELNALLKLTDSPEVKSRIRAILDLLYDKTNAVNGLVLRVRLSKETLSSGETVTIHTTLRNISEKPLLLRIGTLHGGHVFASGDAYTITDQAEKALRVKYMNAPVCGTGFTPQYMIIMPGAARTWSCPITVEKLGEHSKTSVLLMGRFGGHQYSIKPGAELKVQANFQNAIAEPMQLETKLPVEKVWTGKLVSPSMSLKIEKKPTQD